MSLIVAVFRKGVSFFGGAGGGGAEQAAIVTASKQPDAASAILEFIPAPSCVAERRSNGKGQADRRFLSGLPFNPYKPYKPYVPYWLTRTNGVTAYFDPCSAGLQAC